MIDDQSKLVSILIRQNVSGVELKATLLSIANQIYPHYEIHLKRTPGIEVEWSAFAETFPAKIKWLPEFPAHSNQSLEAQALKQCRGSFAMIVESGTELEQDCLNTQVEYLEQNPEVHLVGSQIKDGRVMPYEPFRSSLELQFNETRDLNDPAGWSTRCPVLLSTVLMRSTVLPELGLNLGLTLAADFASLANLLSRGFRFGFIPRQLTVLGADAELKSASPSELSFLETVYISLKFIRPLLVSKSEYGRLKEFYGWALNQCEFTKCSTSVRRSLLKNFFNSQGPVTDFKDFYRDLQGSNTETDLDPDSAISGAVLDRIHILEEGNALSGKSAKKFKLDLIETQKLLRVSRLTIRGAIQEARKAKTRLKKCTCFLVNLFDLGQFTLWLKPWFRLGPFEGLTDVFRLWPRRLFKRYGQVQVNLAPPHPESSPAVTVIIPCYNYGHFLLEAVSSVLNQTWKDLELIVIEGGSTDGKTPQIVKSVEGGRVRCIYQKERCSIGKNRLEGLKHARGKYVLFLDADDTLELSYIEKAVYLLETTGSDVVTPYVKLMGQPTQILKAMNGDIDDVWQTKGIRLPDILVSNECSTVAMFRYSFWLQHKIEYNVEPEFHGVEDWDFWLRLASAGAKSVVLRAPLQLYRLHGNSVTNSISSAYSRYIDAVKNRWSEFRHDREALYRAYRLQNAARPEMKGSEVSIFGSSRVPSGKIKLLLCVPWFDTGGSTKLMRDIFKAILKDVEVTTVATLPSFDEFTQNGAPLYAEFSESHLNLDGIEGEQAKKQFLIFLAKQRQVDAVFIVGSRLAYEVLPELKQALPRLKVFDQLYNPVGHIASNAEFRSWIDFNFAASAEVENTLKKGGEIGSRIKLIPHGVDAHVFSPENPLLRELDTGDLRDSHRFGFLGRLSEEKRPEDMIALAQAIPEAHVLIGGSGPLEAKVRDLKDRLAPKNLKMLGFVNSPFEVYANIDTLVIPSRIEGLPIVLLEAMALGIIVIAARVGEIGNVIEHGKSGFVYTSGNLDELSQCAKQVMNLNAEERKKIQERAREALLRRYTIEACAAKYLDTFHKVLEK